MGLGPQDSGGATEIQTYLLAGTEGPHRTQQGPEGLVRAWDGPSEVCAGLRATMKL